MADTYDKFIPELWSGSIEHQLEKKLVFVEDCTTEFEGEIKNYGDRVRIQTIGKPTIRTIAKGSLNASDINEPEELNSTEVLLDIDQIYYYNVMVGDFEEKQSKGDLMDAVTKETAEGLADKIDQYIAGLVVSTDSSSNRIVTELNATAPTLSADNVLTLIDDGLEKLWLNNVSQSTDVVLTIPPRFYKIFKQKYQLTDTNNSMILEHGKVGMYGSVTVKMSNNCYKTTASSVDTYHCMLRTKRALAFAKQLSKTEKYRPEKRFADAIKGYVLFGAKVVRANEVIDINFKVSA